MTVSRRLRAGHLSPDYSPRHACPLPPDRAAQRPWLVVGDVLVAPFPRRRGGMTAAEEREALAMRHRLAQDQRPKPRAFWINPEDGRLTPQPDCGRVGWGSCETAPAVRLI